ncbi:MAG TPA: hypothetical protein PLA98_12050 [Alicycliphilus sp.]|nr:hypothetical protein [Alicycliphilus sp.]
MGTILDYCPRFKMGSPDAYGAQEGVGIQRHCGSQIHAWLEGVLLEAAVHGHPGVGHALAGHVPGAAARLCDTSPALSLAPMHPTWNKEGSAFDHEKKRLQRLWRKRWQL